ncbi:flavin reductase [Planomonospora parontospora subsp. parontospora]|uniref:Flavin reductase n=2 Tax=Planomonospora parontospora TaxID=58119 RepID=A0AA37F7U3_9ACTN|nr:flavin reductase family protein [Planomonospora parontospora]GGK93009.1 flavin reductase [Planomonospora parontospora]GII12094.1 flavin reductase [Planomonospora parontospora subsp. parontospora]
MRSLREALGQYATGVAVVTAAAPGGDRAGVTVNSFTSVSLDPPLVLWCLTRNSPSVPVFLRAGRFAVNVLAEDQDHLSRRFATPLPDKFAGVETLPGPGGAPLLAGTLAYFACRTATVHEAGDHLILIGEVERFHRAEGEPLVFHAGRYRSAAPLGAVPVPARCA